MTQPNFRYGNGTLIVTKPDGTVVQRRMRLATSRSGIIEVTLIGESQLKGYSFGIVEAEIHKIRQTGTPVNVLPRIQ